MDTWKFPFTFILMFLGVVALVVFSVMSQDYDMSHPVDRLSREIKVGDVIEWTETYTSDPVNSNNKTPSLSTTSVETYMVLVTELKTDGMRGVYRRCFITCSWSDSDRNIWGVSRTFLHNVAIIRARGCSIVNNDLKCTEYY